MKNRWFFWEKGKNWVDKSVDVSRIFEKGRNARFMRVTQRGKKIGRRTFFVKTGWNLWILRVWWVEKLIKSVVLHYLWGIDTLILVNTNLLFYMNCFTLPMRNWHLHEILFQTSFYSHECFTLPMRNWHFRKCKSFVQSKCFTLPMRNWHEWDL